MSSAVRSRHAVRWEMVALTLCAWLLRVAGLDHLALTGDEAYYHLWGRHLDWAYFDHPAGTGVLARVSTWIAGSSEYGVRWLEAVVGTGCVLLVYWVGRRMLGARAGRLAAAVIALGAPYVVTSRILTTNPFHLFLMLLSLGTVWPLIVDSGSAMRRPGSRRQALLAGASMGLFFNTKYTAYIFAGALTLGVLNDYRDRLRRAPLWIAAGVATLGLLPVLVWNLRHDFASFRWQLAHLITSSPGGADGSLVRMWLRNLRHAAVYFTWPLAAFCAVGLGHLRARAQRMLTLISLAMLLPVALSPANSPRNLTTGAVLLVLLAADRLVSWTTRAAHSALVQVSTALILIVIAVYGVGSAAILAGFRSIGSAPWPSSSGVPLLVEDAAGWRGIDDAIESHTGTLYAVDYSLAGQLRYYTGRAVYTSWPQYRLWGVPPFDDVTVVSAGYLPVDPLTRRLDAVFDKLSGPRALSVGSGEAERVLWVWDGAGLQIGTEGFLDEFDFLALYEALR